MKRTIAMLLLLALLAGCAAQPAPDDSSSPSGPDPDHDGSAPEPVQVRLLDYALAQPEYPSFPTKPVFPENGSASDWEAYDAALPQYEQGLSALRGEGQLPEEKDALRRFAAASLPLALAGHEGENAVYSPVSLWSALAMLAPCAQGESREQVLTALGVDRTEALQDQVSRLWRSLYTDDGNNALVLANSIWLNSGLKGRYVQSTLDTLAQKYFAGTYAVPMGTPAADQAITNWISEQTHGLIGGGEPVVQTIPEAAALLASSLYYRAGWTDSFFEAFNTQDIFTDAAGNETTVDFMRKGDSGVFLKREGYQAAELPTQLGSMLFILPEEGVTPESLLQEPVLLTGLEGCQDLREGDIHWSMPKFDVDSKLDLMDALDRLGITDLLDPAQADLSALTDLPAYLSGAEQLSRVKVDEEGVEAASVTMLAAAGCSLPPEPEEICVMDLDRPFLFAIRMSGVPLFVGIVNQVG